MDTSSLQNMLWLKLGSYFFITQAIEEYFVQCKADLAKEGIPLTLPEMAVTFKVSDNDWLQMTSIAPYQLGLYVQLPDQSKPTFIQASLATAPVVVAVQNPMTKVTAENSPEYALFKFFHVNPNKLNQLSGNNSNTSGTPAPNTNNETIKNSKTVPINIVQTGTPQPGMTISITLDTKQAVIIGSEDVLKNTDSVKVELDVSHIYDNSTWTVPVIIANGVTEVTPQLVKAIVTVTKQ
ncbi:CdaR family protein [Neobacillus pocheonensis]|uniref:CdaR family protein n=1 Tax=Neobacillus pocheonensis TaxID=363869 RepID=A0ABT0WGK7_9BACI|nr:CdaR family protein [Neobacillus pocheonensis]